MILKDVDALIKEINENEFNWIDENDKSFLINLINRQPGYDTDKVIEEVEHRIEFEFNWLRAVMVTYGHINYASLDVAEQGMKEIIKYVKRGGVE